MIKILVVEDNGEKRTKVTRALAAVDGVELNNIHQATDVNAAKSILRLQSFDLMILDVALPLRADLDASPTGGVDLLNELSNRRSIYKRPDHVIGITAYEDVYQDSISTFSGNLLSLVHYDASSSEWEYALKARVAHIVESINSRESSSGEYQYDVAVICALYSPELTAVRKLPWHWETFFAPNDHTEYWKGWFEKDGQIRKVVASCAPRMGMSASAVLATKMIYTFRPHYLIMTGITAGVTGRVQLGDILVADPCWDWGSGKLTEGADGGRFHSSPHQLSLDVDIKEQLKALSRNNAVLAQIRSDWPSPPSHALSMYVGPLASGASVLADNRTMGRIIEQHRQLLGVEMEAYGIFAAAGEASMPRPKPIVIKSVVDFADGEKNDQWQPYAAYTSAEVLKYLCAHLL